MDAFSSCLRVSVWPYDLKKINRVTGILFKFKYPSFQNLSTSCSLLNSSLFRLGILLQ